jgi:hypothetical protein
MGNLSILPFDRVNGGERLIYKCPALGIVTAISTNLAHTAYISEAASHRTQASPRT